MTDRGLLQIQPSRAHYDEYASLAEAEDLSYEVLELSTPPALNESGLFEKCKELYRASGRARSLHGSFIDVNPGSGDECFRQLSEKRCAESCEAAAYIGAKNVVFHSSCFPFLRGDYLENYASLCAKFYEKLAAAYNLNIFIENSPDIDPEPLRRLMENIRDERIGVCLDIGHANYSKAGIGQWFEELNGHIGYLHLSDNMGKYDDHLPLGEGCVDWKEADRLFRGLKKDVPMTLEAGGPDGIRRSIAFLKGNGYFGFYG